MNLAEANRLDEEEQQRQAKLEEARLVKSVERDEERKRNLQTGFKRAISVGEKDLGLWHEARKVLERLSQPAQELGLQDAQRSVMSARGPVGPGGFLEMVDRAIAGCERRLQRDRQKLSA